MICARTLICAALFLLTLLGVKQKAHSYFSFLILLMVCILFLIEVFYFSIQTFIKTLKWKVLVKIIYVKTLFFSLSIIFLHFLISSGGSRPGM